MNLKALGVASCLLGQLSVGHSFAAIQTNTKLFEEYKHSGLLALSEGRYGQAEKDLVAAQKEASTFGAKDARYAASLKTLADFYKLRNQMVKAMPLYEKSLVAQEEALGTDSPDVLGSAVALTQMYIQQGDLSKADQLTARLQSIAERKLAELKKPYPNHDLVKYLELATGLDALGSNYKLRGNYTVAEPLLKDAMTIRERALQPGHLALSQSYTDLGSLYLNTGRGIEAEDLYKKSLQNAEKTIGTKTMLNFGRIDDLAHCYIHIGKFAQARQLYNDCIAKGWNLPACYLGLGQMYTQAGNYAMAQQSFDTSIHLLQKLNGREHCSIAPVLEANAVMLKRMQRTQAAEKMLARAQSLKSL